MSYIITHFSNREGGTVVPPAYYLSDTVAEIVGLGQQGDFAFCADSIAWFVHDGSDWRSVITNVESGNFALLDSPNVFVAEQEIANAFPQLWLSETDEATDAKNWKISVYSQIFYLQKFNDVRDTVSTLLTMDRNGVLGLPFGQITFPATQNASSNANTLDDYEEGSFTPAWGGSGGQSGQVYSTQAGRYIKIGKNVIVILNISLTTRGTITGQVRITGLPFTSYSGSSARGGFYAVYFNTLGAALANFSAHVPNGVAYADCWGIAAGGAASVGGLVQGNLANTTDILLVGIYEADN